MRGPGRQNLQIQRPHDAASAYIKYLNDELPKFWPARSSPVARGRASGLPGRRLRAGPACWAAQPKDFDVATDARPDRVSESVPERSEQVGAHFGVVLVRENGVAGGSGDVPQRSRLQRRPPSRPRCASRAIRGRTCCAAISRSTPCCSIRTPAKCWISSAGAPTSSSGVDPRHRRSGDALPGRPSAAAARRALRRPAELRNRAGDPGGHSARCTR